MYELSAKKVSRALRPASELKSPKVILMLEVSRSFPVEVANEKTDFYTCKL